MFAFLFSSHIQNTRFCTLGRNCRNILQGYKDNVEISINSCLDEIVGWAIYGAVGLTVLGWNSRAIVVGIRHGKNRSADFMISEQNSYLIETGGRFFEFVSNELVGFLNKNYRL